MRLALDEECISLDSVKSWVTLYLPVSKNEPSRWWRDVPVLAHVVLSERVVRLVRVALPWFWSWKRLQGGKSKGFSLSQPLLGTKRSHLEFVKKEKCVSAPRADVKRIALLQSSAAWLEVPAAASLSGYRFRRSGAKFLARTGSPTAGVQWLGRWWSAEVHLQIHTWTWSRVTLRAFFRVLQGRGKW